MKKRYTIIFLLCSVTMINAQDSTASKSVNYIFKFSPRSYVNLYYPIHQIAFEHRIRPSQTLQYEAGFNFKKLESGFNKVAYRGVVEFRNYKTPLAIGKNIYGGIGLRFQQCYWDKSIYYLHQETHTAILRPYKTHTSIGLYGSKGIQWILKNGLSFELGIALGLQYYDVTLSGLSEEINWDDLSTVDTFLPQISPGRHVYPVGFLSVKVSYAFEH